VARHTTIQLIDDIDGGVAQETVKFAVDGVDNEIDLSAKNADKLRYALEKWIRVGRIVGARRRPRGRPVAVTSADNSAIRQWAKAHGYDIAIRGRISAEVVRAYRAAS